MANLGSVASGISGITQGFQQGFNLASVAQARQDVSLDRGLRTSIRMKELDIREREAIQNSPQFQNFSNFHMATSQIELSKRNLTRLNNEIERLSVENPVGNAERIRNLTGQADQRTTELESMISGKDQAGDFLDSLGVDPFDPQLMSILGGFLSQFQKPQQGQAINPPPR